MKFFSYESKFSQLLLRLCYACYLNLLWFICSLPIFTIGASTTALYYTSLKIVRGEESYVGPTFFRAFRENFRQATVLPARERLPSSGRWCWPWSSLPP